jgi:hypothetical protein
MILLNGVKAIVGVRIQKQLRVYKNEVLGFLSVYLTVALRMHAMYVYQRSFAYGDQL